MILYSKSIVPRKSYKYININKLKLLKDILIVRRSEASNMFDTFYPDGKVNPKALFGVRGYRALPGFSMNLLGGKFKQKHIRFIHKQNASNEWKEGDQVIFEEYIQYVEEKAFSVGIYIPLKKIHRVNVPYRKAKDSEINRKIDLFTSAITDINKVKLDGKIRIEHKPTILNFWHIELHMFEDKRIGAKSVSVKHSSPDERSIKEQSVGIQFSHYIWEQFLQDNCKSGIFYEIGEIPKRIYKRRFKKRV